MLHVFCCFSSFSANLAIWTDLGLLYRSLLVMRGNSSDMARHVMCQSPNTRVSITFFRVRSNTNQNDSSTIPPLSRALTLWQPGAPNSYTIPNGAMNGYEATMNMIPKWGVIRTPMVMLAAPMHPMVVSPRKSPNGSGTGVFLPWAVGSRKPAKHLPPRAQKGRLLSLPSSVETLKKEPTLDSCVIAEVKMG